MLSVEERLVKLERLIEAQQTTIEAQAAGMAALGLEAKNAELRRRLGENSSRQARLEKRLHLLFVRRLRHLQLHLIPPVD